MSLDVGSIIATIAADYRPLKQGLDQSQASIRDFARQSTADMGRAGEQAGQAAGQGTIREYLSGMKSSLGKGSTLGLLTKTLLGAGALAGISFALHSIEQLTRGVADLANEFRRGKKNAGEMFESIIGIVPVLGTAWQTGRNIREAITGEDLRASSRDARAADAAREAARQKGISGSLVEVKRANLAAEERRRQEFNLGGLSGADAAVKARYYEAWNQSLAMGRQFDEMNNAATSASLKAAIYRERVRSISAVWDDYERDVKRIMENDRQRIGWWKQSIDSVKSSLSDLFRAGIQFWRGQENPMQRAMGLWRESLTPLEQYRMRVQEIERFGFGLDAKHRAGLLKKARDEYESVAGAYAPQPTAELRSARMVTPGSLATDETRPASHADAKKTNTLLEELRGLLRNPAMAVMSIGAVAP